MISFPKPPRGEHLLERRQRRAELRAHEDREMQAALIRDERQCRFCRAVPHDRTPKHLDIPIDPCHLRESHRGQGGNPDGSRTYRDTVIALCRLHHGRYDHGDIDIEPLDGARQFAGPCAFFAKHPITGVMTHYATESAIGVSCAVGA